MGIEVMGKVEVAVKLENQFVLTRVQLGMIRPDEVRSAEINNALVDTGATGLCAPKKIIEKLGLLPVRTRQVRTANGVVERSIYAGVQLTVQGRDCRCDVSELADDCPVLIGQIPLEDLDFVIDPRERRLIGNPAHGGEQMHEEF